MTVKKLRLSKALTISEGRIISDACRRMNASRVDVVLMTDAKSLQYLRKLFEVMDLVLFVVTYLVLFGVTNLVKPEEAGNANLADVYADMFGYEEVLSKTDKESEARVRVLIPMVVTSLSQQDIVGANKYCLRTACVILDNGMIGKTLKLLRLM